MMIVEKIRRLGEGLRMMGMRYGHYYLSYWAVYAPLIVLSTTVQTIGFAWMASAFCSRWSPRRCGS